MSFGEAIRDIAVKMLTLLVGGLIAGALAWIVGLIWPAAQIWVFWIFFAWWAWLGWKHATKQTEERRQRIGRSELE